MTQFAIINTGHMYGYLPNESIKETWIKNLCNQFQMYHASNLHTGIITPLVCNNQVIFPAYLSNVESTIRALQKYKCNSLLASTRHVEDLFAYPDLQLYDLQNLEYISTAATIMNSQLIDKFKNEYNIKAYVSNYGSTELSGTGLTTLISDQYKSYEHAHKSLGRQLPYVEIKVVDIKTGKIQPHYEAGELYFRGFSTMIGYYDESEKTQETKVQNGW